VLSDSLDIVAVVEKRAVSCSSNNLFALRRFIHRGEPLAVDLLSLVVVITELSEAFPRNNPAPYSGGGASSS
jgi:hypothetical protein